MFLIKRNYFKKKYYTQSTFQEIEPDVRLKTITKWRHKQHKKLVINTLLFLSVHKSFFETLAKNKSSSWVQTLGKVYTWDQGLMRYFGNNTLCNLCVLKSAKPFGYYTKKYPEEWYYIKKI